MKFYPEMTLSRVGQHKIPFQREATTFVIGKLREWRAKS